MFRSMNLVLLLSFGSLLSTACSPSPIAPMPQADMPNPASVYCEQHGGRLEMRQDASGGVVGICVFTDGSECDEWAYFRGECGPANQSSVPVAPTEIPLPLPIDPADYQGWWTYTHPNYNFSLMLPEDWDVEEVTTSNPLMNGHTLTLRPRNDAAKENILMTFRREGEEAMLWPTGVGQGEFIAHGTLNVAGQPARRMLLICPAGEVTSIWYHGEDGLPSIARNGLEFGFIFHGSAVHCEPGYSLSGKVQRVGEMIISSLAVP